MLKRLLMRIEEYLSLVELGILQEELEKEKRRRMTTP